MSSVKCYVQFFTLEMYYLIKYEFMYTESRHINTLVVIFCILKLNNFLFPLRGKVNLS